MNFEFNLAIVGGGTTGAATAYKLQWAFPELSIAIIEKEKKVADHQTGNNSGVIHSGTYYKPGSSKARNCVDGRRALVAFAKEHGIEHDICGKIIVATERSELSHLKTIYERGIENGVEDIERISAEQIRELEPYCVGIEGLRVGCTGIIDFREITEKFTQLITVKQNKSRVLTGHEVLDVVKENERTLLITNRGNISAKHVIFCCGLQADRLAKKDHLGIDMKVLGFRGDYFLLSEQGRHKVRNLIYPVPNPKFPFLGVHFTRMISGDIECGPNAVFVFKREGYHKTDFDLKDTLEALGYPGTWRFFLKHWGFGIEEYRKAFSKRLFLAQLQKLIPSLEQHDLSGQRSGVRAMALSEQGEMIDDFIIQFKDNSIHVLSAPSPAATACLAIGEEVKNMAIEYFNLS